MTLDQEVVIVTGATSGIGQAVAKMVVSEGGYCIGIGRNREKLNLLEKELSGSFMPMAYDLTHLENIEKLCSKMPLDVTGFVHAAGVSPTMPFRNSSIELMQDTMQLNVYAGLELSKILSKRNKGSLKRIVYVSSVMAQLGEKAKSVYSMSKGALEAAARTQALELSRRGVCVNCVAPAVVDTPLTEKSEYRRSEERMKKNIEAHPLGLGKPEDVAYAVVFLLSQNSRWITGTTLTVDGGYSIR